MNNIIEELKWREMLKDISNVNKILDNKNKKNGIYCGFDPTSDSLHIGNLIQLLVLKRFKDFGFKPFVVIGQGTAIIGDPSGKKEERQLKTLEEIKSNFNFIQLQIKKIIPEAVVLNNNEWLGNMSLITFLRDIGKSFNVSYLINKEHIRSRLSTGISYTEFTYPLLQAYDFFHLYKKYNISIQIGGSDQWGNIVSGIEYIKNNIKLQDEQQASGLTIQLLLKPDGTKFGKTESGTIWLDRNKTSPYIFYQFFFNQTDQLSLKLLKYFTFYNQKEIEEINKIHLNNPKNRYIQTKLASYVTKLVHSEKDLNNVIEISKSLFNGNIKNIKKENINLLVNAIPTFELLNSKNIIDALISSNICISKREAREFLNNKAIIVNDEIIIDDKYILNKHNALYSKYFLIKKGKKNYFLIILK